MHFSLSCTHYFPSNAERAVFLQATGTLTIPFRNVTGNATVYYSFADRGVRTAHLRVIFLVGMRLAVWKGSGRGKFQVPLSCPAFLGHSASTVVSLSVECL